jgi:hypothetical protein
MWRRTCRSSTTTATFRWIRSAPTIVSDPSPRSGSMATTTSGGPCALTAWPSDSAPGTPPTSKSSRRGRRRCRRRSGIRSITGPTWSCSSRSVLASRSTGTQRGRSTIAPRRDCRRTGSPRSACCSSSAWPRSAPPTTRSILSSTIGPLRNGRTRRRASIRPGDPTKPWPSTILPPGMPGSTRSRPRQGPASGHGAN